MISGLYQPFCQWWSPILTGGWVIGGGRWRICGSWGRSLVTFSSWSWSFHLLVKLLSEHSWRGSSIRIRKMMTTIQPSTGSVSFFLTMEHSLSTMSLLVLSLGLDWKLSDFLNCSCTPSDWVRLNPKQKYLVSEKQLFMSFPLEWTTPGCCWCSPWPFPTPSSAPWSPPSACSTSWWSTPWTGTTSTSPTRDPRSTRTSTAAPSTASVSPSSSSSWCCSFSTQFGARTKLFFRLELFSASPCSQSSVYFSWLRCFSMHLRFVNISNSCSMTNNHDYNCQGISPIQYTITSPNPQHYSGADTASTSSATSGLSAFARQNVRNRKFLPDVIRNFES